MDSDSRLCEVRVGVDYQQGAKHSIFGRYVLTSFVAPHPYLLSNSSLLTLSALDGGFDNRAQSYALGSMYLISPNTINALRLSVHRMVVIRSKDVSFFSAPDVGVNAYTYLPHFITICV